MSKKFYITTSIFYVNAAPHLGSALEMIQADVLACYYRQLNRDVFFLTGTDEHGIKIFRQAVAAGKSVQELVDENSRKFKALAEVLNISYTDFIRTTDQKRHWPAVQKIWAILDKKGDIYKGKYRGLYCVGCEAYLTQNDLVDGKCPFHQKEPEILEEENYFFRLTKYIPQIKEIIEKEKLIIVPLSRKNEVLGLINQGVKDISISRPKETLKWGVPVEGDNSQVIYVWFEALCNYLSGLGYPFDEEKFRRYWPADIHCLGKDILRFHTILWPAMLLSANLPLPKKIFVHGYLTIEGQKLSKSLGKTVDPFDLAKKYSSEALRYYLLREFPATEDGDFSVRRLEERYQADLANGLGNLTARILTLSEKAQLTGQDKYEGDFLKENLTLIQKKYTRALEEINFREALEAIWEFIGLCDEYLEKNKPWELIKTNQDKFKKVLKELLGALKEIAFLLKPFLPVTSEKILAQIEQNKKTELLFPRL